MALKSCYECNKNISSKAVMCSQCGVPQNPVSGLMDKVKDWPLGNTFKNLKKSATKVIDRKIEEKEIERKIEEILDRKLESYAPSTSTLNESLFRYN
jgi:hypothetical protein